MIVRKKIYCKRTKNEWKGYHNKIVWLRFVLMQDPWQRLASDSTSWQKDTEEFSQFTDSVPCREYTLPRDEKISDLNGWIRGNTQIEPVLEVTTCCLQGKYGVEIRLESLNKDNSHSRARISHDLNKLVTNLNNKDQDDNEQETSEMQFEDYAFKLNASDFASRWKAKAKPQRRTSASSSTKTFLIGKKTWTDIEPQEYLLTDYSVSKKLINLLRRGSLTRENDGAIEFCRIKDHLRNDFVHSQHWFDEMWKSTMARGGGNKKISLLYWSIRRNSLPPSSSRSFRTQSCWSFITGECLYPGRFLQVHLSRWMCNQFTFHHLFRIDNV